MPQSWLDFAGESIVKITFYWLQVLICSHSTTVSWKTFFKMGRIYHTNAMLCPDFDLFHNANQQMYPGAKETAGGLQTKVRTIPQLLKYQKWCLTPLFCPQTWTLPCHLYPFHEKRKYSAESHRFSISVLFPTLLVSSHLQDLRKENKHLLFLEQTHTMTHRQATVVVRPRGLESKNVFFSPTSNRSSREALSLPPFCLLFGSSATRAVPQSCPLQCQLWRVLGHDQGL